MSIRAQPRQGPRFKHIWRAVGYKGKTVSLLQDSSAPLLYSDAVNLASDLRELLAPLRTGLPERTVREMADMEMRPAQNAHTHTRAEGARLARSGFAATIVLFVCGQFTAVPVLWMTTIITTITTTAATICDFKGCAGFYCFNP